tara:strand:- start:170 stop:490 length:321 start_codon:yes stop_codon:yes gene_type:complete
MEYDIELTNEDNLPVGRVKFYEGTGYEPEDDTYCFHGMFTRLEKAKFSDEIIESTEIIFELWFEGDNKEWGEGVNPRQRHLTDLEQSIIIEDFSKYKEEYIENYGQ